MSCTEKGSLDSNHNAFFHFNLCETLFLRSVLDTIIIQDLDTFEVKKVIDESIRLIDSLYDINELHIEMHNKKNELFWEYTYNESKHKIKEIHYKEDYPYNRNILKRFQKKGGSGIEKKTGKEVCYLDLNWEYSKKLNARFIIYFSGKKGVDFDKIHREDYQRIRQNETFQCLPQINYTKILDN